MKKILALFIVIFSFTLVSCNEVAVTEQDYSADIELLQEQLSVLESKLELLDSGYEQLYANYDEMQKLLVEIGVIEGLNGQNAYYLPTALSFELLGTELEKDKAPSYVLDENEDYVPFADVAQLLVDKYFSGILTVGSTDLRDVVYIYIEDFDNVIMSQNEYLARSILMLEELGNYDFYIIGSTGIQLSTSFEYIGTASIKIPMQSLRSEFITLTPEVIYTGAYEVSITQMTYNIALVQAYYDGYVLNETFSGYVLDFK